MALGAITSPLKMDFIAGNKKVKFRTVQLSTGANYTTGGETVTPAAVGLKFIAAAVPLGKATTTSGTTTRAVSYIAQADGSVKQLVQVTADAEAASNSDQSTFFQPTMFIGF